MEPVHCPYCKRGFDSDDMLNADLYPSGDEEVTVTCPSVLCKKKFLVNVWMTPNYEVKSTEEYEEDGGFY